MKKVTDTSRMDPTSMLLRAMLGGGASNMIEDMESEGQREAVNSDQLPTKGLLGENRAIWEAMGVKIITPGVGAEHTLTSGDTDPLFTAVELPKGWKKQATDHAMWNHLLDDKGRIRAKFFYKAAPYDRRADIRLEQRFTVETDLNRDDYRQVLAMQVKDGGKVVFSVEDKIPQIDGSVDYAAREAIEKELHLKCVTWLVDGGYPDYRDPSKYWE